MAHITKNISLFPFHYDVVKKVQEDMRFSKSQGFSEAVRYIIREYADKHEEKNSIQGENGK